MECPFCSKIHNEVIDSRLSKEGIAIRRRRRCLDCAGRFTTFESTDERLLLILMSRQMGQGIKANDKEKLLRFIARAFRSFAADMEKSIDTFDKPVPARKDKRPKRRVVVSPKKKAPKKGPAGRQVKKLTANAQVYNIIKRHKKGVNITELKERTGLADYKIRNIVYTAHKEGKIKRIGRGVYAPA